MRYALVSLIVLMTASARVCAQTSQAFAEGVADRATWEGWFQDTGGDFHAGAAFWLTHRADPNAECRTTVPVVTDQWIAGCEEARQRLARFSARMTVDPIYRQGWNSFSDKSNDGSVPPASVPISPVLPRKHQPRIPVPGP